MSRPSVASERLVLRPPEAADIDTFSEYLADYEVSKMLSRVPYPYDEASGRAYLEHVVGAWQDPASAGELSFHIDHEGRMIGCLSFKKLQDAPEIGYWLGRPHWGRGYMSEALRAGVLWLFQNTDHTKVAGEAMTENPASLKVMEKIGFRTVGDVTCDSVSRKCAVPAIRTELKRSEFLAGL